MKILFVYTDINTMGFGGKSYHFGLGILSAVLKQKGYETKLFYAKTKRELKNIFKEIESFKPDVIGFTSDTTQFSHVKSLLKGLSMADNTFTVLGGCHVSLYPDCLKSIKNLNAICIGEGEETLSELVNKLELKESIDSVRGLWVKKEDGGVVKNPSRSFIGDLDKLPFADYGIFGYQQIINSDFDRLSFMLSRGCPFNCTYCASPAMGKLQEGKYVRFMSVKRVIDELRLLKSKYKFKTIFFADDTFTINKQFVAEFCQEYKNQIGIPFEVNARVETISVNMLSDLKDAGCFKIHMGIEHGNERFRREVLNRNMSNQQIIDAFKLIKDAGMASKSYNIVGFPLETEALHQDTVKINQQINPDGHVCYIFQPYPGTKMYEVSKENNFIDSEVNVSEVVSRRDTVLNMANFSPREIRKSHKAFSYRVYKEKSLLKALVYKIYYSRYGEKFIRLFSPIKSFLRAIAMK